MSAMLFSQSRVFHHLEEMVLRERSMVLVLLASRWIVRRIWSPLALRESCLLIDGVLFTRLWNLTVVCVRFEPLTKCTVLCAVVFQFALFDQLPLSDRAVH